MHIDNKIASEFCKQFITAAAFRAYLKPLLEAAAASTPAAAPVTSIPNGLPLSHKEKAKQLLVAIKDGEFDVDPWETKFVSDQCYVNIPSESQENRLDMLWSRYQDQNA